MDDVHSVPLLLRIPPMSPHDRISFLGTSDDSSEVRDGCMRRTLVASWGIYFQVSLTFLGLSDQPFRHDGSFGLAKIVESGSMSIF